MAADATILVDVLVNKDGAKKDIDQLNSELKSKLAGAAKAIGAAFAAVGAGVVALVKQSVQGYAEFEQLVGGVETLFKDSAKEVLAYAQNAYKTAGISANKYMETATSFSASLLQSLGGDTAKAARIADMAIQDMADNANKMGTSIESIQYAYQGFAKQNYTMLDNLKLGYGGTKKEMERLLEDAQKLTGIKYDISNLNDVFEAIHVIQTELGITGTTAKEAATTIQGSWGMMKAAWSDLITGMAYEGADFDRLLNNLIDSAATFAKNVVPAAQTALSGVVRLVEGLAPQIAAIIPQITSELLPQVATIAMSIIESLVNGIITSAPALGAAAADVISILTKGLVAAIPNIIYAAGTLVFELAQGIAKELPTLIPVIVDGLVDIAEALIDNVGILIDAAIELVQGLAEAIAFGEKAGLDMKQVLEVIGQGAAQSWQMDHRGPTMIEGRFDFGFAVDWMRKDLGLVLAEARRNGARLPVTALVDQFYGDLQRSGGGRLDSSSLIERLRG